MIAKRLGAIALTVAMIAGAWLIRSEVIDDDGGVSGDDDPPPTEREIVCVSDLVDTCRALADARDDLGVSIEDAAKTLEALAALEDPSDAPIWITMAPFPEMVDNLREIRRLPVLETVQTRVASSPIALVVPIDRTDVLAARCGAPLRWDCVGEAAGEPWEDIGGDELPGDVRPAFAPIDSALGLLGVADAISGYFGSTPIALDDLNFTRWASGLADAVPSSSRPPVSAIATIRARSSALDVAVGAAAELPDTAADRFTRQYAEPMIRADVVVVVPEGASLPSGLADEIGQFLEANGWDVPSTEPNPLPTAPEMFAIRDAWREFL
jgi:hypothetical protein